ncbi:MAG: hydrogenase maturation nickel metallochaperone HypA [Chloroflexi bacterium]|nr:hydrogenase maturation nickel metallochaperone HypA [Chloroflexota bacterium]
MHELPITQGILEVVIQTARANRVRRVTDIYLVIGELTSIVDDSVQFYFDILSKDTLADGAKLHFRREPATATCQDCAHQWAVKPPIWPACPACKGENVRVSGGREFYVESIEVEE